MSGWSRCSAQPFEQVTQRAVAGGGDRLVDVLGLPSVTVRRHHHAAGDAVGDPRALFLPDQVKARVDAGGGARAGDHRVVIDVEDVRIDLGRGVAAGQFFRVPPVRGAAAAIQQAGLTQDEGAAADAQHPRATIDRPAQRQQQIFGKRPGRLRSGRRPGTRDPAFLGLRDAIDAQPVVADRGQGDQVRFLQPVQAAGRLDGEVIVGAQRRRFPGYHGKVVGRQPVVGPVDAKDLADGAELERKESVDDHDGDVTQHGYLTGRHVSGYQPS